MGHSQRSNCFDCVKEPTFDQLLQTSSSRKRSKRSTLIVICIANKNTVAFDVCKTDYLFQQKEVVSFALPANRSSSRKNSRSGHVIALLLVSSRRAFTALANKSSAENVCEQ
ncbi:hypothetical protein T07_6582 [Trichinella nelsoni]|uniref:Uncharacterized protein n=1 Tax=Trichinella nelsoni TaxID=6336 RepID=A0A0V0RFF1_9BILA|nr:hypothetical protein T07_6582 [Trichinella nelsoni]